MIFQLEMANAFNSQGLSTTRSRISRRPDETSLPNHKLKLPPISPNANLVQNSGRSASFQQENFAAIAKPHLDLCSHGLRHGQHGKSGENKTRTREDIEFPTFSIPRVYTVLPPIGQKPMPSAPAASREDEAPRLDVSRQGVSKSNVAARKRTVRNHRVKKQTTADKISEIVSGPTANIDISLNNNPIINGTVGNLEKQEHDGNGSFAIHISDPCLGLSTDREAVVFTVDKREHEVKDNPDEDSHNFSHIPKVFQPYIDIYPPSPPPTDRRARVVADKKRQEIREENKLRLAFMKKFGERRRNATCAELDDILKNATELLRELFLRKTMEELCMVW